MIDDASELRIAIGRVLERWQAELRELDPDSPEQRERCALLASHIDDLKRVVTPDRFTAEVQRAARLVCNPPDGDRIGATLRWIDAQMGRIENERGKGQHESGSDQSVRNVRGRAARRAGEQG